MKQYKTKAEVISRIQELRPVLLNEQALNGLASIYFNSGYSAAYHMGFNIYMVCPTHGLYHLDVPRFLKSLGVADLYHELIGEILSGHCSFDMYEHLGSVIVDYHFSEDVSKERIADAAQVAKLLKITHDELAAQLRTDYAAVADYTSTSAYILQWLYKLPHDELSKLCMRDDLFYYDCRFR
jgi:hypothetical protein